MIKNTKAKKKKNKRYEKKNKSQKKKNTLLLPQCFTNFVKYIKKK